MSAADDNPDALERLSALADGEADARVVAAISAAWRDDGVTRARWHCYQLIGDVMRSDELAGHGRDAAFLATLRGRLAEEPVVLAPAAAAVAVPQVRQTGNGAPAASVARSRLRRWAPPAALAAGFMVVAVGAMTVWRPAAEVDGAALAGATAVPATAPALTPQEGAPRAAAEVPSFATLAAPVTLATAGESASERAPAVLIRDPRLDAYLAAHQQFGGSSALGVPSGFLRNATHEGVGPASR
ncbi:MAG TPA: sigma-E factor negative regulatory protein [Methylibium sp.]|nr:sigma-E factor negative regulatory protein [Methylibium sp.]